jgi:hypothetical protein
MRFSRFSTLPTKTGTLAPCSVMTWNWSSPCSSRPEGQAGQELLDGGVARPDGEKDQVALVVTDAAVGHQVGAFVDAVQRLGRRCRHGDVLE